MARRRNESCIKAAGDAASPEATMRDSRTFRAALGVGVCLIFTGGAAARADSSRSNPAHSPAHGDAFLQVAPHQTWGPTVRVGTVVGTVDAAAVSATGLGLSLAAGHRFGRLTLEAELGVMNLQEQGPSSLALGRAEHLGLIVRYDVVRTTSKLAGPNTLLALFVEGGAAQSWAQWYEPASDELQRIVPRDTRRLEGQAGFGLYVDHRFSRPGSRADQGAWRLAWHLGWRFAAPSPEEPGYACRGACRLAPQKMPTENLEGSVLFQSSLALSW
jgi:hypothetical protein